MMRVVSWINVAATLHIHDFIGTELVEPSAAHLTPSVEVSKINCGGCHHLICSNF